MKRVISALLVFCMMFGLLSTIPAVVSAEGAQGASNVISNIINKVADGLDENNQTNVTLTVPGVTDSLGMDIVYITGGSLSEEIAKADVKIQNLKDTIEDSIKNGTPVNFGIVTYSYTLDAAMPLTQFKTVEDLEDFEKIIGEAYAKIEAEHNWNDGTGNMEQALINAKKMLTEQNPLKDHPERQHIVLYSSGHTYEFNTGVNNDIPGCAPAYVTNADGVAGKTSMYWTGSSWCYLRNAGSSRYYIPTNIVKEYTDNKDKYASDWDCYWSYITKWVEADRAEESSATPHFYAWEGKMDPQGYATYTFSNLTAEQKQKYPTIAYKTTLGKSDLATAHAIIYERAMYEAYEYAKPNIIDAGINLHPIYVPIAGNANYINGAYSRNYIGHSFMDMLAGGKGKAAIYHKGSDELFFASVKAQILYSTAAGSWVEDVIGYEEGKGNFEFIKNPEYIKLVVGDVTYRTEVVATQAGADLSLAFTAPDAEKATFELHYFRGDGKTTEKFRWYINESVSLARPASLTYRLQLTEMQEEIGGYIVPANIEATFHPVDSEGKEGKVQYFRVPKVTYTVEPITVSGVKVWDDNNNQDGIRPEEIEIYLYANGQKVATTVTNARKNWKWSFEGLLAAQNGQTIEYTVTEKAVEGYETAITGNVTEGFTITNAHTVDKVNVTVTKVWEDNNNQDGIRPDSVTIKLLANEQDTGKTVVLNAENNWTATFTDLDKNANGTEIPYTVQEVKVDGYDSATTGNAADGFIVTNTHEIEKTEVVVNKVWDDSNDQDRIRPESVTIKLLANGKDIGKTVVLSKENNWTATFAGLDKNANGTKITYTVQEDLVEGYEPIITGDAVNGFTVTNFHKANKTEVTVNKVWEDNNDQDGARPGRVTVKLLANGKDTGKTVVLSSANNWTATFTGLDMNVDGVEIKYTVQEVDVRGYTTVIIGDAVNGFTIINTHRIEKTGVRVTKVWEDNNDQDGIRPDSITVKLFANGKDTGKTVVLNAANNWTARFANLDLNANGTKITYTVQEVKVDGYTSVTTGSASNGFTITNTHEVAKTEVKVNKVWDDSNNQDGLRPGNVTIKLLANGKDTGKTVVLNAENNWSATFTELDLNANGVKIVYTVKEVTVAGYTPVITGNAIDGFTVTNTHEIGKTGVTVNKVWKDNNDQDGIRPDSITIKLFADGKDTGKTVVLNEANNWSAAFTGLNEYANGTKIAYTVEEVKVDGYTTVITGNAIDGFTVTNTHIASTSLTLGGIKYLDDVIAEGFTFVLADANGNIIGRVDSAADGKFVFGAISYNEAGVYKYVITEVAGNNEDIYYDVSAYTVIVTVAVEGEKLVATYELSKDGEAYEGDIEFRNETLTEIEDEDPPEHDSPDTGDNIGIFMMLGALSVTAFFAMNIFEKSRRKTN